MEQQVEIKIRQYRIPPEEKEEHDKDYKKKI
jgi:hypothetical protein